MLLRILFTLLLFCSLGIVTAEQKQSNAVVFLHFNDFYELEGRFGKGGLLSLEQIIAQQKQSDPNAIITFGGDLLAPSVYSATSKGQHMIEAMALINVDVAVAGNHEFDFGLHNAVAQFKASKFPWVISNLKSVDNSLLESTVQLYVHKVNGVRIGFMGFITPQLAFLSASQSELMVANVIATAQTMVSKLKKLQVDMIVALTHLTLEEDKRLAHQVKDIDLILGGHDHYPLSLWLNDTLILKSGMNGEYLGIIKAIVDKSGVNKPAIISWQLLSTARNPSTAKLDKAAGTENSPVIEYLEQYQQRLQQTKNKRLAKILISLDAREAVVRSRESSFANLVADALRQYYKTDIALINGGAIRSDKVYPAGTSLTENDILSALPFANRVGVVKLSGKQLLAILEHGVAAIKQYAGRFPQLSGISLEYSPQLNPGQRIGTVMIADKPIAADKYYTLATVDFLLSGGDGYEFLPQAETVIAAEEGELLSNIVSAYLLRLKQVQTTTMGRLKTQTDNTRVTQ